MCAVFDDLEQQAQGLHLVERDAEVAALTAAEYSRVSLAARLHASVGQELRVELVGGQLVTGRLARLGDGWFLLVDGISEWVVRAEAVATLGGLSPKAHLEDTWSPVDRLTLRGALRRLADEGDSCLVHFVDDRRVQGRIGRVGLDFFELISGEDATGLVQAVPHASVAAWQGRR